MKNKQQLRRKRSGNVLVLIALTMVGLMLVVAFAVDYGYLLVVRTDMQRAADAAALAAVRELTPDGTGSQAGAVDRARAAARDYVSRNLRANFGGLTIPDEDIECGRYERSTINSGTVTISDQGMMDTVRVTLRRDGVINQSISLFFGRVGGRNEADMTVYATAVLRPGRIMMDGNAVLPIAVDEGEWNELEGGDWLKIYGDGKVETEEGEVPGNFGTVDIGNTGNATSDLRDQIVAGLRQEDIDYLANDSGPDGVRIPDATGVPPNTWMQGETGLSAGMQQALDEVINQIRYVPIVDQVSGQGGNNAEFHMVRWGVVRVVAADLQGSQATKHVTIEKHYTYDGTLKPIHDLSTGDDGDVVDGAFGAAGLVE